jgi:hypothetical protein
MELYPCSHVCLHDMSRDTFTFILYRAFKILYQNLYMTTVCDTMPVNELHHLIYILEVNIRSSTTKRLMVSL